VRATFEVSYRQLTEEDARLFRLLGLHPGPDFTAAAAAAALADIDNEAVGPVLGRLAEAYLVTEDAAGRFGMHDLLRLYARGTCQQADSPANQEAAERRLVGYYMELAGGLDACVDPQQRSAAEKAVEQAGDKLLSIRQALAIFQAERPNLIAIVSLAAQRSWDKHVFSLGSSMAESLRILRYSDDVLVVGKIALASARHTSNTDVEGMTLNMLGNAYTELRRFEEAITCFQQALKILGESSDLYNKGTTLNNLGAVYADQRQIEEAITCFQQALKISDEISDLRGEGMALNNLGAVYADQRRFEEAISCFQRDVTICREIYDRRGEGQTLNNLGIVYAKLQRFEEAITCFQQALTIRREIGDRYGESQILRNLGFNYQEMQQPKQATKYWLEAAEILHDEGDHQQAQHLEQLAASIQSQPRRWWGRRRRPSSLSLTAYATRDEIIGCRLRYDLLLTTVRLRHWQAGDSAADVSDLLARGQNGRSKE
jgi:tetratricopeptide (TPR) repeat protein